MDYRKVLESREYDFLRNDLFLKDNILFLTVSGSYAYGVERHFICNYFYLFYSKYLIELP